MEEIKPYTKYKPSGIAWLGEIPEHWEVRKLKNISKIETGTTPPKNDSENYSTDGFPWIKQKIFPLGIRLKKSRLCLLNHRF